MSFNFLPIMIPGIAMDSLFRDLKVLVAVDGAPKIFVSLLGES